MLANLSERSLLAGQLAVDDPRRDAGARNLARRGGIGFAGLALGLIVATLAGWIGRTSAFFGAMSFTCTAGMRPA